MNPFLQQIVDEIPIDEGNLTALRKLCFVFPSRRAAVYFRKYLADRLVGKYFWSPQIFSIVEFAEHLSDKVFPDTVSLVLELFRIYQQHEPQVKFDEFFPWGQLIIKDFDDVDNYLVNAQSLFSNLKDVREMEKKFALPPEQLQFLKQFWNVLIKPQNSDAEKEFLRIWEVLGKVYPQFKAVLEAKNAAYPGMAMRQIAEQLKTGDLDFPFEKVVFAGFNALAKVEERIISLLADAGKATIYWDVDDYYMSDPKQEAGAFVRRYYERWIKHPAHRWHIRTDLRTSNKNIHLIGVPLRVGQAKYAGAMLQNFVEQNKLIPSQTAVVLGDESLLFPMLYALPDAVNDINVTMGYPLRDSPLYQLLTDITALQKTKIVTQKKRSEWQEKEDAYTGEGNKGGNMLAANLPDDAKEKLTAFYGKTIISLINNPFIKEFNEDAVLKYTSYIEKHNIVYVYDRSVISRFEGDAGENAPITILIKSIFSNLRNFLDLIDCFQQVLLTLHKNLQTSGDEAKTENNDQLNQKPDETADTDIEGDANLIISEFIYHMLQNLQQLEDILRRYGQGVTMDTFWKLFREVMQSVKLPFTGEPLRGLQIMGFLETRTLDFKNVFALGINEGNVPATKPLQTFIPFHLRKAHGMPVFLDQDAIFAYHFYHILQRAENLYLFYNSEASATGDGEKSRFLLQVERELPLKCPGVKVQSHIASTPLHSLQVDEKPLQVAKMPEVLQKLNRYLQTGEESRSLSPSGLSTYINCPVQFYLKYVAQLRELLTLEEDISPNTFGNILHKTIELLYKPFVKNYISREAIESILKNKSGIKAKLNQAFKEEEFTHHRDGINLLLKRVIERLVTGILRNDAKDAPFRILGLETAANDYKTQVKIDENRFVNVGGVIDRIDEVSLPDGSKVVRILDYKTGNVNIASDAAVRKLPIPDYLEMYFGDSKYRAGFQAYLYAWLYWKKHPEARIVAGIYALKEVNAGIRHLRKKAILNAEFFEEFERQLQLMLVEIFEEQTPFTKTDDDKAYEYSAYSGLVG